MSLGSSLVSENGHVALTMQHNGNLVVYSEPSHRALWSTKTDGKKIKDGLIFQGDGNLVLYNLEGKPVWASNTTGTEVDKFVIQNDGNFVGSGKHDTVYWQSRSSVSTIWRNDTFYAMPLGSELVSENGKVRLVMEKDGNLVINCDPDNKVIWSSKTQGITIQNGVIFQSDGNLVLYNFEHEPVWTSNTDGTEVDRFVRF